MNNQFGSMGNVTAHSAAQIDGQIAMQKAEGDLQKHMASAQERMRQVRSDQATARSEAQLVEQTALLDALTDLSTEQTRTLAAVGTATNAQVKTLAAMHQLSEDLASERRRSKWHEEQQAKFNKRMSWAALLLAGAAVVVPFITLWIEQALR